jgi:hypothetical protein
MAFDKTADKELFKAETEGLAVSVNSYKDGKPKLQIGPRFVDKDGGERQFRKVGRLSASETAFLFDNADAILQAMEGTPEE